MSAVLKVQDIAKSFGGVEALRGIGFDLAEGDILGLIGPNGAGKTTLFNMISGLLKPDRGRITLGDKDITELGPHMIARAGIGRTFQNVRVFADMTVLENVMVGRHTRSNAGLLRAIFKTPGERREERQIASHCMGLLEELGIAERAHEPAANLAFGRMRILEIARALASEPRVILLDEPAAGLNHSETDALADTIRGIREKGISVVLVEHDMRLVMEISDRVVVMNNGTKLAEGLPREVQNNPEVIAAYLGEESCRFGNEPETDNDKISGRGPGSEDAEEDAKADADGDKAGGAG